MRGPPRPDTRAFRLMRVFKLARSWSSLYMVIRSLLSTLASLRLASLAAGWQAWQAACQPAWRSMQLLPSQAADLAAGLAAALAQRLIDALGEILVIPPTLKK